MMTLHLTTHASVATVFDKYPEAVQKKMQVLRQLIIDTARETEGVTELEETLKWGEPAFVNKQGSTFRIDWKPRQPEQYAVYFNCNSELIPTFELLYSDVLRFEGRRAIIFKLDQALPVEILKTCFATALRYHKVKKLPMLGL